MDFPLFGSLIRAGASITGIPVLALLFFSFIFFKLEKKSIRKPPLQWEITPKMFAAGLSQHVRSGNGTS